MGRIMTLNHFCMQGGMEMNCQCDAYPFPHRPLGGACDGEGIRRKVEQEGWDCQECPHCEHHNERHPYGDGHAIERWRECRVSMACECPGVLEMIQQGVAA